VRLVILRKLVAVFTQSKEDTGVLLLLNLMNNYCKFALTFRWSANILFADKRLAEFCLAAECPVICISFRQILNYIFSIFNAYLSFLFRFHSIFLVL
jgi:hypothetical protein